MSSQTIDGKAIAKGFRDEIKLKTDLYKTRGITPGLAVILVGDDSSSKIYVDNKIKACQEVGFNSEIIQLPATCTQKDVLQAVKSLNSRPDIHGFIVQLPLPPHISEQKVIMAIEPKKDVDGLHPLNLGCLLTGNPRFVPCTPLGCMKLIEKMNYDLDGKNAVVVGRSNIVGKPIAALLMQKNATVTICHSRTKNLAEITRQADVLIAAVGKAHIITADMIKPGAFVIDVGMNRLDTGKVVGDVDFVPACAKAAIITPVPGGVGPMTIAMLMSNTLEAVAYEQS